ncbi:polysaccharide deacetylase family protein [Psychroserpens sp. SPM9]|uniref:polysaccharide deacetylase family protein n=1 Tax=Psychroserpens sp. SPM9 TaxID=2975598 RepID=UPI0021A2DC72|nr:polysaccharide deacetylase family protein [Psychroserpens sp. SPM9]MDG5490750.1 polysaccharide deacetylase family protein [Psychroserpens sp. SPM9]
MKITPVKTPLVAKKMFPNYVWDIPTTKKELFLTFDDGPTPEITQWTLDTLKQYNAKATFFCIGSNIEAHPDIFNAILKDGNSIGNHTHQHIKGWSTKTKDYLNNVLQAQEVITKQTNSKRAGLFRPPYGQIKPKQGKELIALGYKIIMWDVLSFDWEQTLTEDNCLENVLSKSKPGSIIVFHDSIKASKNMMYALPKVLETFSNKGYVFKSLT